MQPTAEQQLILDAATSTTENLLITARAGAAKTTTLLMLATALPRTRILCLAFNKKIAEELQTKLPENAEAKTMHSLGNAALKGFLGKWPKLNAKKCYFILKGEIDALPPEDRDEAYASMSETLQIISRAKNCGYLPEGVNKLAKPVMGEAEMLDSLDEEPSELQQALLDRVLRTSFKRALEGEIDFDDMVYLPAMLPVSFPSYPLTMVDESQDLSPLNHVILRKLVRKSRIIAVGDPCQAIYAFRGALESSMKSLREQFSMQEFFLTVCFRSSEAVVRNARWRAPDMHWGPSAPDGAVHHLTTWDFSVLQPGDAIICRNNAPLFKTALALIKAGLYPELYSGDIVASLGKVMKKLGKATLPAAEAMAALDLWREGQEKKERSAGSLRDKYECMQTFIEQAPTLGEAIGLLEDITRRAGNIKLMTGHKSKGLEFDRVFILNVGLCKKEGQDPNIRYVMETRAKRDLYYIDSGNRKEAA